MTVYLGKCVHERLEKVGFGWPPLFGCAAIPPIIPHTNYIQTENGGGGSHYEEFKFCIKKN